MFGFLKKIFDSNEKQLSKAMAVVEKVNEWEDRVKKMSFSEMRERIKRIRSEILPLVERIPKENLLSIKVRDVKEGLPKEELDIKNKLYEYLPEVFAMVREVTRRKYDRRHFDVQVLAGVILAQGNKLVEVKTGEGKTQIFYLPIALYAVTGRGAHVVTVNDYLSKVGGEYAGHILSELGFTVGVVVPEKSYRFVPDDELLNTKGEDVYNERMKVKIRNPNDVRGWNLVECSKKEAYNCDIVYGINNEFGFDYLRDNMATSKDGIVQRELYFCIVDEVDSILIDEARTPLIISAPAEQSNELYHKFASIVEGLNEEVDYTVDEKAHSAVLTDRGIEKVEKMLGVQNLWEDYKLAHHLDNALKAKTLYRRDDDYIVKDGQVLIIDQFTGRILPGRRYSEGLHQAIEAKEGVEIKRESKTLATITFQNFFRLYKILCGASGTVMTEAEEFYKIYNCDSVAIPTNVPVIRKDLTDRVYKNQKAKFDAVVKDIIEKHSKQQPVLVGTTSVETSEMLSRMLDKEGIPHEVLNAKYHEKEAHIIARAGEKGAVTVATNMAGRGTDIRLGKGVKELGGLHVIGTERHDARRIDNQLRGRSGRQGDPGSSRFYVALDDEIMRMQGGTIVQSLMERTNIPDDMPIESKLIGNAIERAQKRMEGYHFDIRNNLVKYDDVMNQQREVFYMRRRNILELSSRAEKEIVKGMSKKEKDSIKRARKILRKKFLNEILEEVRNIVNIQRLSNDKPNIINIVNDFLDLGDDEVILAAFIKLSKEQKEYKVSARDIEKFNPKKILMNALKDMNFEEVTDTLEDIVKEMVKIKEKLLGEVDFLRIAKLVLLQAMDQLWSDHLDAMQDLREGIGLRGIAQRDPLVEYKNEAFNYFESFINSVRSQFSRRIFKVRKVEEQRMPANIRTNVDQIQDILTGSREMVEAVKKFLENKSRYQGNASKKATGNITIRKSSKVGRNDLCPCGSGKKYKKCCGR